MSNPIANPTGATRYVNVRQLITRFGCKCGTTQINKPFASKYCMRNCTEVNKRGAGKPPFLWPNRVLL